VVNAFAPLHGREIMFVLNRAYDFAMNLRTDTEVLPWQTSDGTPVDSGNWPLWVQGDTDPGPVINPAIGVATPTTNCDGYVGDGHLRIPADEIENALSGRGDGASIILNEQLVMQAPVTTPCWAAAYPNLPDGQGRDSGVPQAQPRTTVRFQATLHYVPYPSLGPPKQCSVHGLRPADTTDPSAWLGLWADQPTVEASRISAEIDADAGSMDVSTHEVVHLTLTKIVDSSLSRTIPWIRWEPDYVSDKYPSLFLGPGGPPPPSGQHEHLMSSNNVELEAYVGTCADGTPTRRMRYLRRSTNSSSAVVTDVMLQPAHHAPR
jgi:hypothetical protein